MLASVGTVALGWLRPQHVMSCEALILYRPGEISGVRQREKSWDQQRRTHRCGLKRGWIETWQEAL